MSDFNEAFIRSVERANYLDECDICFFRWKYAHHRHPLTALQCQFLSFEWNRFCLENAQCWVECMVSHLGFIYPRLTHNVLRLILDFQI